MIPLTVYGKASPELSQPVLGRVRKSPVADDRGDTVLILNDASGRDLAGYVGVMSKNPMMDGVRGIFAIPSLNHLEDGDVVLLQPSGMVRTLYRRSSHQNAILATDRCNSLCLMCSQPPREVDDQHLVKQHLRLIELIDPATRELGITGGRASLAWRRLSFNY